MSLATLALASILATSGQAQSRGDVVRPRWQLVVGGPEVENARCTVTDLAAPVSCGTVTVQEDRTLDDGRRIKLGFTILRAFERDGTENQPHPIFVLPGSLAGWSGPGVSATDRAEVYDRELASLRQARDLVLIDPRGTGTSDRLACHSEFNRTAGRNLGPLLTKNEAADCWTSLSERADLSKFSTRDAVQDLEDMRIALGYGRIDLLGISFGSRLALEYARAFPRHVGRMVLFGAAPLGTAWPTPQLAGHDEALERIATLCAEDQACDKAYWRFERDLRKLDRRFEQPVTIEWASKNGKARSASIDRDRLHELLQSQLSSTEGIAEFPALVRDLTKRRYSAFFESRRKQLAQSHRRLAHGQRLAVLCTEDLPLIEQLDRERTDASALGYSLVDDLVAECSSWSLGPIEELDEGRPTPLAAPNPSLILTGELDPITPPAVGREVASHLPNGTFIEIPSAGHDLLANCPVTLARGFFDGYTPDPKTAPCIEEIEPPRFTVRHRPSLWSRLLRLFDPD